MAISPSVSGGIYSMVNSLGRGFDIFESYDIEGLISNRIFDWSKSDTYETDPFLGQRRTVPKIVSITPQTGTTFLDIVATSRAEVQTSIAAHANVEGSYGPFSGEFKIDYSTESQSSSNYYYALRKAFVSLGYVTLDSNSSSYFADDFKQRITQLPDNVSESNMDAFTSFFQDYGFYYIDRLSLGGELNLAFSIAATTTLTRQDLSTSLKLAYEGLAKGALDIGVNFQGQWKTFSENSNVHVRATGGAPDLVVGLATADPRKPTQGEADKLGLWTQSLMFQPALMDMRFTGIWKLCGNKRDAVEQAFRRFGVTMMPKVSITSSPKGPTVVIGGALVHPDNPTEQQDCGFHLVIVSRKQVLGAAGIKLNKLYSIDYTKVNRFDRPKVYDRMLGDIDRLHLNSRENLIILASYNLDHWIFPPYSFYQFLRESGGASQDTLGQWQKDTTGDYAHLGDVAYCLLGVLQGGDRNGIEGFAQRGVPHHNEEQRPAAESTINAYLARAAVGDDYEISASHI